MKDHYKIEYGKIIHTIELSEKDLDVVRKLHKRINSEYNNGVIDFYDLDKSIIDDLKWADLIEIRNSIIFLSCDTINLLIRKEWLLSKLHTLQNTKVKTLYLYH